MPAYNPICKNGHNKDIVGRQGFNCKQCSHDRMVSTVERKKRNQINRILKRRWSNLYDRLGITEQQWAEMFESQKGVCAICSNPQPLKHRKKFLAVDHCHESGKIRGLLCSSCNLL